MDVYFLFTNFFLLFLSIFYVFAAQQILETTFPDSTAIAGSNERLVKLRMLGALPNKAKMVCTGFVLPTSFTPIYITQIKGYAPSTTVHHMALYGCNSKPPTPCGCPLRSRSTIFVSSLNTPDIRFQFVRFGSQSAMQIGGSSSIKYVNIEVHYSGALNDPDTSTGADLRIQTFAPQYFVGIYSIMGVGTINPGQSRFTLDTCFRYMGNSVQVFGYQVHTHSLGTAVAVYTDTGYGLEHLARGNPQFPQAFLPISKGFFSTLFNGASVATRCVYDTSSEANPVYTIGVPGHIGTEMCFVNLLFHSTSLPGTNPFYTGTCDSSYQFPINSPAPFLPNNKLNLHALYGNQTGTVSIYGTNTMNLDLENF